MPTPSAPGSVPVELHVEFPGRLVFVGFGSIGQGVLPLILRHVGITANRITIVTGDARGAQEAAEYGVQFIQQPLTRENFQQTLAPLLHKGDFLLNLSVDVSSLALVKLCAGKGVLYLDTCIEPWPGGYTDPALSPSRRTNYALREQALELRTQLSQQLGHKLGEGPTAVLTHGANPGLVSHFLKQALLNVAADTGVDTKTPRSREEWARLSQKLGVKVVHIAERDTQIASVPKRAGEFVNTWSCDGFVSEGAQPAELGWGTHERNWPPDGHGHDFGRQSAIYLLRPGAATQVRTWTPLAESFHGLLITHGEAISISDYFTVRAGAPGQGSMATGEQRDANQAGDLPEQGQAVYRPTVHYSYHPCNDAVLSVHEFAGRNWHVQPRQRILMDEVIEGIDELGVLLAGHKKNAYWFGSQLSIEQARRLAPHNNATSLQVCVAVLSGLIYAMENPNAGIIEPDEMDFARHLEICYPYLGDVVGKYTDWTPLTDRGRLFQEDLDTRDPWQFKNVRV
jgi:homospermidine synthase